MFWHEIYQSLASFLALTLVWALFVPEKTFNPFKEDLDPISKGGSNLRNRKNVVTLR